MAKAALVQEYPRVPHLISVNGEPWTGSRGRDTTGCAGLYRNELVPAPAK